MMYKFLHAINIPIHVQEVSAATACFSQQADASAAALPRMHRRQAAGYPKLVPLAPQAACTRPPPPHRTSSCFTPHRMQHAAPASSPHAPRPPPQVCVFTAPLFSAFCSLAAYGLVKEAKSEGAGIMAAALIATVPSFISRSIAGSFDNEGVAIFALVNCFYLFVRVRCGEAV